MARVRVRKAETIVTDMDPKRVKRLRQALIRLHSVVSLALTYFEDGAPHSAERFLRRAMKTL